MSVANNCLKITHFKLQVLIPGAIELKPIQVLKGEYNRMRLGRSNQILVKTSHPLMQSAINENINL